LAIHFGNNSTCVCLINTKAHMDMHSTTTMFLVLTFRDCKIQNGRQIQDGRRFQQNLVFGDLFG
jgi:hypothetical protein